MLTKTKTLNNLQNIPTHLGIVLMTLATTLGSVEANNHIRSAIVLPNRPVLAFQEQENNNTPNPILRERDETVPHYISYSETQRTPSRSSRH